MRFTRLGWLPVFAAGAMVLSGCAAPAAAPSTAPTVATISEKKTCAQVMDIGTLVFNLSKAHREGRLLDAEWQGAGQLAVSMAAQIDVEPGTALADAVQTLRSTVPRDSSFGDEWILAFDAFKDLCGQEPLENFGTMGWTGG